MTLDRASNIIIGAYMMIYHFRLFYLLFATVPFLVFIHRLYTEIPEQRGYIDDTFHLYAIHVPILMGFITLVLEDYT